MPHLSMEETLESTRGETWTLAGGSEVKKEGKVTVIWRIDWFAARRCIFKAAPMSRTWISVDRSQKTGHGLSLTKSQPRTVNMRTGEIMPLKRRERRAYVHLGLVDLCVDGSFECGKLFGFCAAEVEVPSGDFESPRSDLGDEQLAGRGCHETTSIDKGIPTVDVGGKKSWQARVRNGAVCRRSEDNL